MKHIKIILERTSHPGNIGSTARAMKTMGLSELRLVNTVSPNHTDAYANASGADDILFHAKSYQNIASAVNDCHVVFGLSARKRDKEHQILKTTQLHEIFKANNHQNINYGFLFGNEKNGLSNADLAYAHHHIIIPTQADFKSLNLAQAVQIIAYLCHTYF